MNQQKEYEPLVYKDQKRFLQESTIKRGSYKQDGVLVRNKSCFAIILILIPSLILNILLSSRLLQPVVINPNVVSEFSKLAYDTPVQYHSYTDYWGENDTLADERWNPEIGEPLQVALSHDYVRRHGLEEAERRFPWDHEKGLYQIKAFHQLHCLRQLRQFFIEVDRDLERTISSFHFQHCLDAIRQDIMCTGDDTLMPLQSDVKRFGDGQIRQCRDWNKLKAWAVEPERNACVIQRSGVQPQGLDIEDYAFCPEESKYYSAMREYFEIHGHDDEYKPYHEKKPR